MGVLLPPRMGVLLPLGWVSCYPPRMGVLDAHIGVSWMPLWVPRWCMPVGVPVVYVPSPYARGCTAGPVPGRVPLHGTVLSVLRVTETRSPGLNDLYGK